MSVQELLVPNDLQLFLNGTFNGIVNTANQVNLIGNSAGLFNGVNVVSVNLVQISLNIIAYNAVFNQTGDVPVASINSTELIFPFSPSLFPSWAIPATTKTINSCVMVINGVTKQAFFKVVNAFSGTFGNFSLTIDNAPLNPGDTFRFIGCSGIYNLS